ncbi:MAG: universal stress protein [Proteobacteria bacterium]|nr:universal stress protein [Pseudomonadota bacterium]
MSKVQYKPRKILVALDGSDPSGFALAYAAGLAARVGSPPMVAIQVVPPFVHMPAVPGVGPGAGDLVKENADRQELIQEQLRAEIAPYAKRFDWEAAAAPGAGGRVVAREAEERGAQLVVLGSHGRTGAKRVLLGSFAEEVVRHSTVPVLVVRQPTGGSPEAPNKAPPAFPPARVIAPTDFSDPAHRGVQFAASLAEACDARLELLHALKKGGNAEEAQAHWSREQAEIGHHAPTSPLRIVEGSPVDVIVEAAGDGEGALVVLSSKGRTGAARLLLGSVAERIARTAPCPVLIVK